MSFTKDTPEAKSWIYDTLLGGGVRLPTVEGFSVKGGRVIALFERLRSSVDVKELTGELVGDWLRTNDLDDYLSRLTLAANLRVPLYTALWHDKVESFRVLSITEVLGKRKFVAKDERFFTTCRDLASWIGNLKGIQVSKGFVEPDRLSFIDECLRRHGVPWPGNLDGFLLSPKTGKVSVVFELARTRQRSVKRHNLNDFFKQDFNRWKPLDVLRTQLGVPLFIITWSSAETELKVQKLQEVGETGLKFETTEFLEGDQITSWFKESCQ